MAGELPSGANDEPYTEDAIASSVPVGHEAGLTTIADIPLPISFDTAEPSDAHLVDLQQATVAALTSRGLMADEVLFAGYHPDYAKAAEGEFATGDGGYQFYFGDVRSLGPGPAADNEDPGDRWMANPIRYATAGNGQLGVYDRDALGSYIDSSQTDADFGTYVATATPEQIAACQTFAIQFTR